MKARVVVGLIGAVSLLPASSFAVVSCPDRAPTAISSVAGASQDCQEAITKEGGKFLKKQMKALSKCIQKEDAGVCPTATATEKIENAANDAAGKIAAACGADAAQDGLSSSYGDLTDDAVISTCMLSQHNVTGELLVGNSTGLTTENFGFLDQDGAARATCIKELAKQGVSVTSKALKNATKCINKAMEDGFGGDLVDECVGQWSGGTFDDPDDASTQRKQDKVFGKAEEKIAQKCAGNLSYIPSIFACAGSTTVEDLQNCIICEGWDGVLETLAQQYSESGAFVANGPGAIQTAVTAAGAGDKLLIESGDYAEQVVIATDGLQLVGCGGATGDRPVIERPAGPGPFGNGIFATGRQDLLFQSLEVLNWDDNGIFVSASDGLAFRDIIGDGDLSSEYAIFPVTSNDIVVEGCEVYRVTDAGIYVGQSTNYVIRHNRVEENVAGIEVENSQFAEVHNNYATNNTGGILVFKLPGPPLQIGEDHYLHHNVTENNNTPNFGSGTVGVVPDGTGFLILTDKRTEYEYNISRNNNSLGFAMIDQEIVNFLALPSPPVFSPTSPDQAVEDSSVRRNKFGLDKDGQPAPNGTSPDTTPPNSSAGIGGDIVFALFETHHCVGGTNDGDVCVDNTDCDSGNCDSTHNNCFQDNLTVSDVFLTPSDCTP